MASRDRLVMVVDDDRSVREALSRWFRSAGLAIRTFASYRELLDANVLDDAGCIVLDVQMAGVRGMELQRECQRRHRIVPIIMISASDDEDMTQNALAAGALAYLRKPFDAVELLDLVRQALGSSPGNGSAEVTS